jgi:hypothetical protein
MGGLQPRWLLGAALLAAIAGVWLAVIVFDSMARG